jgi:hypothetical protein
MLTVDWSTGSVGSASQWVPLVSLASNAYKWGPRVRLKPKGKRKRLQGLTGRKQADGPSRLGSHEWAARPAACRPARVDGSQAGSACGSQADLARGSGERGRLRLWHIWAGSGPWRTWASPPLSPLLSSPSAWRQGLGGSRRRRRRGSLQRRRSRQSTGLSSLGGSGSSHGSSADTRGRGARSRRGCRGLVRAAAKLDGGAEVRRDGGVRQRI